MSKLPIQLADEICARVATANLGAAFRARRRYQLLDRLSAFSADRIEITVRPLTDEREPARTETARKFVVEVGLQQRLPDRAAGTEADFEDEDQAAVDALLDKAGLVADLLQNAQFEVAWAKVTAVRCFLYESRHLDELRLVTSLLQVTLEGQS